MQNNGGQIENNYATTIAVAQANNNESSSNVQLDTNFYKADNNPGDVLEGGGKTAEENYNIVKNETTPSELLDAQVLAASNKNVCRIGSTGYTSLYAAMKASTNGDKIIAIKDVDNLTGDFMTDNLMCYFPTIRKNIYIDLNGYTLDCANAMNNNNNNIDNITFTLINGTVKGQGGNIGLFFEVNGGKLILKNVICTSGLDLYINNEAILEQENVSGFDIENY